MHDEVRTERAAGRYRVRLSSSMVAQFNPSIALEFTPLAAQVDASLSRERLLASLSGFFGGLALLLATVGLYGTLSPSAASTSQRDRHSHCVRCRAATGDAARVGGG